MKFWDQICPSFYFRVKLRVSNIIFRINKPDLLWVLNFIALGVNFIFGAKFSWNACFNVKCVLLVRSFDFLEGYLVVTASYLSLPGGYWSFLVVTAHYRSLLLIPIFSICWWCDKLIVLLYLLYYNILPMLWHLALRASQNC